MHIHSNKSKAHSFLFHAFVPNTFFKWCSINVGLSCSCIVSVLRQLLIAPLRSSSSSSLCRCAHHLICTAMLIIIFAPPRSSSSLRHRGHHILCAITIIFIFMPSWAQAS
jgi:hypothetical protein